VQIVQLDWDLATICNHIAVLEDPSISTKPDVIKQLYGMIAGVAAWQVELVNSIRLRLALAGNKSQESQGQTKHKEQEQEHTANIRSVAPEIPVRSIAPPDEVQSYDCYGNPLSTWGLPLLLGILLKEATGAQLTLVDNLTQTMAEVILVMMMMMMTVTVIMITVVGAKAAANKTKDISVVRPDLHMKLMIRGTIVKRTHSVNNRSV
jgi:hypothetical protein